MSRFRLGWILPFVVWSVLLPTIRAADATGDDQKPTNSQPPDAAPDAKHEGDKANDAKSTEKAPKTDESDDDSTLPARLHARANAKPTADDLKAESEYFELYKSLADTIDQVDRNYVKPIDRRELMEAAIKGILTKLDPYSNYISPEEITSFRTSVESQFGGIGIQITVDEGQIMVSSPLLGTPAYRAGVQAGDRIVKVEGESTRGLPLDEVVRRLKGEVGTSVTFTVLHALGGKTETFTIQREVIHVDTVTGNDRKADDSWNFVLDADKRIGYIRLNAFSRDTAADLKQALEELQKLKMRGLILDLRFNPGGLLTSAIEVSDLFISEGRIVSTNGRNTPERVWDAVKPGTFEGFPMVVLVNHYSASASEIVSACLQDHNRAVVVGDRTWGKGSVQNVIELEDGKSALKLTTATYTRPNGHNIHRFPDAKESDEWGVKPNDGMEVKLTDAEMSMLLADRRQREIVHAHPHEESLAVKTGDASFEPKHDAPVNSTTDDGSAAKHPQATAIKSTDSATDKASRAGPKPDAATTKSTSRESSSKFVDRQLQKALDYLNTELARAQ